MPPLRVYNTLTRRVEIREEAPHPLAPTLGLFPEPRLQVEPRQDLEALQVRDRRILEGYGWVDRSRGIVRIPVEEALEQVAAQGLPARNEAPR